MTFYNTTAQRRIARAVEYTEALVRTGPGSAKNPRHPNRIRRGPRQAVVVEAAGIDGGDSGEVQLYIGGVAQVDSNGDAITFTAYNDWIYGADAVPEKVSEGKRVYVDKFWDDGLYRITGADCETPPAPAPPGHGNDIVATGTDQSTGYDLNFTVNRVTTVTASDYSVVLPDDFEQEDWCVVRNASTSGGILSVWPAVGDEINELTDDVAVEMAPGESYTFWLVESDHWVIS